MISLALLTFSGAEAHDFTATIDGQRLYFEITDRTDNTASVTFSGSTGDRKAPELKGTIKIPPKIKHDGVVYTVSGIGAKAFAGAKKLERIEIPAGVETIGDFAFEGCSSLKNIVFPGNQVEFGQGVFFKCGDISSVTFGSDWKNVDLTMFRWSRKLTDIMIPAKIEKIQGLKKLKYLENISVDPNNSKFSSVGGILYSKDGKIMYGCPRAYSSNVIVQEGTEKIEQGALIDCANVTYIDFPTTLKSVSFRETSRMAGLQTIVMRGEQPVMTSYIGGEGRFLFLIMNPKMKIIVPNASKNIYEKSLASEPGQYSDTPKGVPYTVKKSEMPEKKNIKGVKNFENY